MRKRTSLTVVAITTLGISLTLGLSGCINPLQAVTDQVANNVVENAVENATGGDVSFEGGSIPDTWPADVPKPSGKVLAVWCEAEMGCSGSFEISDAKGGFDSYVSQLTSSGFTQSMDMSSAEAYMGVFDNGTTSVTVSGSVDTSSSTGNTLVVITTPTGN